MNRYLILAQSVVTARALGTWLQLLGEGRGPNDLETDPQTIVWERSLSREDMLYAYKSLSKRIACDATLGTGWSGSNDLVILVDAIRPDYLNAIDESGWESLIAALILAFPDVHWVFGYCSKSDSSEWNKLQSDHCLPGLLTRSVQDSLFDSTGLRNFVSARTNAALKGLDDDLRLVTRKDRAAAIDDEESYGYLHAYTAYRFGLRADAITTWFAMEERFGLSPGSHGYWLLLEDMSLNFPDRPKDAHLLSLVRRAEKCPKLDSNKPDLESSNYRILVTTGQARAGDTTLADNRAYLDEKAKGCGKVVFKPVSGMFDLWSKCGLYRKQTGKARLGNVGGFDWPPSPPTSWTLPKSGGHGAPGRLLQIAETLIRRAENLLGNVQSVRDAVLGAVLATDALELTGARTPTTAIAALSLKHRFEVLAECRFSGVEYHLSIRPRLAEISVEVEAIAKWFDRKRRDDAKMNAEMTILYGLVGILRENFQFDEEQICMNRVRHLHNSLWIRQSPARYVMLPLLKYLELLLSSFAMFIVILAVWVIILSMLFVSVNHYPNWGPGFADAISSFFSVGAPLSHQFTKPSNSEIPWGHVVVACIAIFSGFVHLGVFVSHLYSISSRK